MSRLTHASTAVAVLLGAVSLAHASSPRLNNIRPEGWQRGQEVELTLHGRRLNSARKLLFYRDGISVQKIKPLEDKGRRCRVKVAIDEEAPLGEHQVRLLTDRGWTDVRTFFVGNLPVAKEDEGNNSLDAAQAVDMNTTVHGVVRNEDEDLYKVEAKKGQRISAEVEAMRLGRKLFDPYVAILDADRFELHANDDNALTKQDPFASAVAPEDGTYFVKIREAAYGGSGNSRYRLHIGAFPRPAVTFPMGYQAGETAELAFRGDPTGTIRQAVKPREGRAGETVGVFAKNGERVAPSPNWVRVSSFPAVGEGESNDGRKKATAAERKPPLAFNGTIEEPGDQDWYRFSAKGGQRLEIHVHARELGSRLDPVVNFYKAGGKHLEGNDDSGQGLDSHVRQKVPGDGKYEVRVRDKLDKGGPHYTYRVEVRRSRPELSLEIPNVSRNDTQSRQFVSVPQGNRWGIVLRANRRNFRKPLEILGKGLPDGVTMHAPEVPKRTNQIPVVFEAKPKADLGGGLTPLRARPTTDQPDVEGGFEQVVGLIDRNNERPYKQTRVEQLPVAVTREAPFKLRIVEPKIPLVRHGRMRLKIKVERDEGFNRPIRVVMPYRPPGMNASSRRKIGKGESETDYPINANGNAPVGEWPLMVIGRAKVDGGPLYVASQLMKMRIGKPLVRGEIKMGAVERGETARILCKLDSKSSFEEKGKLVLRGLPNAVKTEPQKISQDTKETVFEVETGKKSPIGKHKSLSCRLTVVRNGEEIVQTVANNGVLRIDKPREPEKKTAKKGEKKEKKDEKKKPKETLTRLEKLRKKLKDDEED